MLAHQESCVNSGTNLELTVINWQPAQVVCPREHCCWCVCVWVCVCTHVRAHMRVWVRACMCMHVCACVYTHTDFPGLSSCAHRIWLNFDLSTVCTFAELEYSPFSLSVYSVVCPKHTPNQHFESPSLPHSPTHSQLSPPSPLLSLPLFHPSSCPCLLKPTAKDCGIHFGNALSTANVGHSKLFFFFVCLDMASHTLASLRTFSAQVCADVHP